MTAKGSTRYARGIGVVGLSIALVLGVGSLGSTMAAKVAAAEAPGPLNQASIVLDKLMATGEFNQLSDVQLMERLEAQGVFSGQDPNAARAAVLADIKARRYQVTAGTQIEGLDLSTGIGRTPDNPIRIHALHSTQYYENGAEPGAWALASSANQSRSGFYPLPNSDSLTIYSYENDFVFRSRTTNPAAADIMDIITFGGQCPMPPECIYSIETLFSTYGAQPNGQRARIRFWSTWNGAAAAGTSVVTNQVGATIDSNYGPLPVSLFWLDIITLSTPICPTHNDNIGMEFKYTDNVTDLPTSTTHWFATGPPIGPFDTPNGPPASGSGPPAGSSANFFYRDVNANGILESQEALLFSSTNPQIFANLNMHIGGFPPPGEVEPNNNPGQETALCKCERRPAQINPATDVDRYSFRVDTPFAILIELKCIGNTTLTLRDPGGVIIGGPVNGCPASITTGALAVGTYKIEVTGDGSTTLPYEVNMSPVASEVTGMKFTTAATKDHIVWNPQFKGVYDVVRGNISLLHSTGGNFADPTVLTDCWDVDLTTPGTIDTTVPTGPLDSLFYLSRAKFSPADCGGRAGYDEPGVITSRDPGIAANPNACP